MKTKATLFNVLVVVSMILALTAVPVVTGQVGVSTAAKMESASVGNIDRTTTRALTLDALKGDKGGQGDTGARDEVDPEEIKHTPTGAIGPHAVGPFSTEAVAGSFDGDLRDLPPAKSDSGAPRVMPAPLEKRDISGGPSNVPSPAHIQHSVVNDMPAPLTNFAGQPASEACNCLPPDTEGDVGSKYYIQYVNVTFSIYDKTTTNRVVGPLHLSSLFNASQAPCNTLDDGDPIALYDSMADRWLLTQFGLPNYPDGPFYQCMAVSKTSDPVTGGWWTYTFPASTPAIDGNNMALNDYPKLSVWPDAYYMTANMFPASGPVFVRAWALDRARMLAGRPIRSVFFDVFDTGSMLASNLRGDAPPAGSPELLLAAKPPDKLNFWTFHVDFEHPASSTFTGPIDLPVDNFLPACGGGACIPQQGTTVGLDTLSPRLMYNLQYRRVGNTESLWANDTISESSKAAVRWYEVRLARGGGVITPTLYQQSTFNPADGVWRWMGSIAADKDGNAAVGYSASSPTIYPQIRYAGRLVTDTLNVLAQGEFTMTVGGGAQLRPDAPRWGDYSAMTVDPVDDCTFWYTQEYYTATSTQSWATRIGSFKYPSCTPLSAVGYITGTVYDNVTLVRLPYMPVTASNVPLTRTYAATTDANGVFTMTVLPGSYTVYGGPLSPNYPVPGSAGPITVTSGNTATINVGVQPYPILVEGGLTTADPAPGGNGNGYPEPGESGIQLMETISNTGTFTATNVAAQITALTPGVTVITPTANYGTIAPGAAAVNATPFGFSIDGGVPCGTALSFMKVITSDQRVFTITFNLVAALPPAMSPVVNTYVSTDVPKPIPDANPNGVNSVVNVPGDFLVGKATASLTISHTYDSDLDISLVNPADTSVLLSSGNGGNGDNYVNTVFDDAAATPIVSGTAPFTGAYQPQGPLATFNSNAGGGQWKLHAVDTAGGDTGTIVTWTLKLVPAYCVYPVPNLKLANVTYADVGGTSNGNGFIEPGENSINVLAALQNVGITTATSISAALIPQTPGISMNVGAMSYPNIDVGATVTNSTPFNFAVSPSYACGLPINFNLNESTARGDFAQSFTLPTGQGPAPANVFYDDVESGQGSWITGTTYTGWSWQITTEDSHSPTHSWTDSPSANYPVGGSTWLESPVFDFSAYDDVTLSFYHKYATEAGFDFGFVEVSTDGGATWLPDPLAAYDGVQSTWTQATVALSPLAHHANTRFRFRLFSDPGVVADGWHIDDIRVTGMKRICNPVSSDWQKLVYVNGVLTTTSPINVKPGDVLQVVDRVNVTSTSSITFALTENWSPAFALSSFAATAGSVVTTSSSVAWNGNNLAANTTHALTKTFTVLAGPINGTITESLVVENGLPLYPDRVLNFNLPGAAISVPGSLSSTQVANNVVTKTLTISNTGAAPLIWNIFEFLPSRAARLTAPQAITSTFSEGFDDITTLVSNGWARINHSNPVGTSAWFQGNSTVFTSQAGAPNSYIGANYNNTGSVGTISNWLLTPEINLKNGDTVSFYTRVPTGAAYPDRLEVRMSTAGSSTDVGTTETSVGVFTTTLLTINPNLVVGGYPDTWTVYTVTVSGLSVPVSGRFAFRYFVTNGGANGANSDYIGIDSFTYATTLPCSTPVDIPWLNVAPTSGTTAAGASSAVNLGFNSTGLAVGTYNALVCVASNDPINPVKQVPVSLTVVPLYKIYLPLIRR